jgi:hypothetical protein
MSIETNEERDADVRERLTRDFAGRATVRLPEAAAILKMTEKTLRRHVAEGNVRFRATGTGSLRMRREFTVSDLVDFYGARSARSEPAAAIPGRPVLRPAVGLAGFTANIGPSTSTRRNRAART